MTPTITRTGFAAAAATVLALALAGPAAAQAPIVIKFSHVVAPDTPKGKGADKFRELAEKYTGGKVKVEVYPNSQLYKDKEELEALQLGAIPQVMAFSEVYQALQTGVVDGTENTASNEYSQKMHEVQKYTTLSDHGYIGYAVIVNKKFWDGMPADIRTQVSQAMDDATKYANSISQSENDDALAEMKKSGKTEIITLTADQKAAWRKALQPVYDDMSSRVGKAVIDEFIKEANAGTN